MIQRETKGLKVKPVTQPLCPPQLNLGHHNERPVTGWVENYERMGLNEKSWDWFL
jgi:hypothetical protein